ncbi:MAG: FKBP-type peptidyl-prolyl cis-trans isomerase [Pseudomonadota bacterium]
MVETYINKNTIVLSPEFKSPEFKENMQKLLTLIIAAAMIYQIMNAKMTEYSSNKTAAAAKQEVATVEPNTGHNQPEQNLEPEGSFLEKSLSKLLINILKTPEGRTFFENMIQPVNKPITGSDTGFSFDSAKLVEGIFRINTTGEGKEGPVSCGAMAAIDYRITTMNDIIVDEGSKMIQLGRGEVIPALENIIVGMHIGQTREGVTSAKYAYDNPKFRGPNKEPSLNYKVKVTLRDILPKVFMPPSEVRIFDDKMAYQLPYLCSERATFDVKISKIDGKVIYDTESNNTPISMILGDMAYPMVFSHALFSKIPTGTRTVIAQGKYLKSLANKDIDKLGLKERIQPNEFFLIEFKNFNQDGR